MKPGDWVCAACTGELEAARPDERRCLACGRSYPVEGGILDLRLAADPYIEPAPDRAKAAELCRRTRGRSFEAMIEEYYAMTPEVRPGMAARYAARALAEPALARLWLAEIAARAPSRGLPPRLLQVGCRTGGFLEMAACSGYDAAGTDVAFRWLAVAGRRLESAGAEAALACANAEHLPLPDACVDIVVAADVLQHLADPAAAFRQFHRVLRPGGGLYLVTPNRFSVGPEPHTWIWALGYLPRPWAQELVRRRGQSGYENIHLLSLRRLRTMLAASWVGVEVWAGSIPSPSAAHLRAHERRLVGAYEALRSSRLGRGLALHFGPLLHAWAEKPAERA